MSSSKTYSAMALLLALLILSIYTRNAWVFLHFKYNQDQIAAELCIEKDVVASTCNGNCQLSERISQSNQEKDQAQSTPAATRDYKITWNTPCPVNDLNLMAREEAYTASYPPYLNNAVGVYLPPIFHPPIVIS